MPLMHDSCDQLKSAAAIPSRVQTFKAEGAGTVAAQSWCVTAKRYGSGVPLQRVGQGDFTSSAAGSPPKSRGRLKAVSRAGYKQEYRLSNRTTAYCPDSRKRGGRPGFRRRVTDSRDIRSRGVRVAPRPRVNRGAWTGAARRSANSKAIAADQLEQRGGAARQIRYAGDGDRKVVCRFRGYEKLSRQRRVEGLGEQPQSSYLDIERRYSERRSWILSSNSSTAMSC